MGSTENSERQSVLVSQNPSLTSYYSNSKTHFGNVNHLKRMASGALESARAKRTKSLILDDISCDISSEDSCFSSHRNCHGTIANSESDNEECLSQLFFDEGAKKKLKLLGTMVGVESTESGIVLVMVVAVLKELRRRSGCLPLKFGGFLR